MQERSLLQRFIAKPEFGPFVLLALELLVFWSLNPEFLSLQNISNTLAFTVELGLIALAMTLLMTSGEFDLSVGSVFGFSAVVMWTLFNSGAAPMGIAFLIAIAIALFIGFVNGLFVTRLNIPSFLVTLGMLLVVRGSALFLTDGFPQRTWSAEGIPLAEALVGQFFIGGFRVYMSLFWFILAAVTAHYVLTQTKAGNWIQASGGNANAARARGVNVGRTKIILFMVSSALGRLCRHHLLHPHLRRQPEQRHRLRTGSHRHGRHRRHGADRRARHDHWNGAWHFHSARHAKRHCHGRGARPCLQYFHRRHHPWHDGAAFMA